MNNLVQNETSQFGSFQSNIPPSFGQALAAWAQSTDGLYHVLAIGLPPPRRQDRACRRPIRPGTYSGPAGERADAGGGGDLYTGHRGDLFCGGDHRLCRHLQSGGRERADFRAARILCPDSRRQQRDAGRPWLLHAVRGRDDGVSGAGADHIGHGGRAVYSVRAA